MLNTSQLSDASKSVARVAIADYLHICVRQAHPDYYHSDDPVLRQRLADDSGKTAALLVHDLGGLAAAW